MIGRAVLLIVAICSMFAISSSAGGEASTKLRLTDFCLGSACLQKSGISKKSVQAEFGIGRLFVRSGDDSNERSICYADPTGMQSAEITFTDPNKPLVRYPLAGITVTTQKICAGNSTAPKKSLPHQIGNVRLGMAEEDLVKVLGKPVRIDDAVAREKRDPRYAGTRYSAVFGEKVYVYNGDDELGFVFVFISVSTRTVSTVWAAISE